MSTEAEASIARARLERQGISMSRAATPAEAAASQLATQAQDFHGAKWALALRSNAAESDVDAALAEGSIVRSWPMRGTLMMMARADARWLTELLAPRSFAAARGVWRRDGLVEQDFVTAADAARDALAGGRRLGRAALLAAFAAAGVDTAAGRGSHLLRRLAGEALICFGAPQGTEQTFALLDEWAPDALRLDRDEALALLAERYVRGHGPATVADLAWWSGLTLTDTRRAVALAGERVEQDPAGLLVPPGHDPAPERPGEVHLLPPFDELLLGYRDRSASLAERHFPRVVPHSNGLFSPTVTVDGVVVGVWRRTLVGADLVDVGIEPFEPFQAATRERVEAVASDSGRFLGDRRTRVTILG